MRVSVSTASSSVITPPLAASRTFQVTVVDVGSSSVLFLLPGVPGIHSNTLTFSGLPNATYVTEFATNLPGPCFSLMTNLADTNGRWSVVDSTATNAARFYRTQRSASP